jgi:CheY-like chemotaxis protein
MPMKEFLTLIVDDNQQAADVVASILRSLGARKLRYASTEEEAYRAFCAEKFDILIVDQNLGKGGEGIDLVRRIRTDPSSPNVFVPILMVTAYSEQHRVLAARDAGISEFLAKPFSAKEFATRLELLINSPRNFVRSSTYFGPDRRRSADPGYGGPERRQRDNSAE